MKTKTGIISFLLTILIVGSAIFSPLKATDTAALLPPGVNQFFDNNGNPLTSGKVYFYEVGTFTFKTTWKDSAEAVANTNPITLDAGGKAIIYGFGTYRQIVKDRNGNLIWDAVTAPGGSGGSTPTAVGDGNLVGTVLPWSGLIAPNQYVFAYGQEISRTAYPEFYTATTQQLNVICSIASNILTGISDTSQVRIGSPIELALCVAAGTTVTAKTAATITLSNPSSVSINSIATFYPWGNGNGSTTFNVPDFRGYVIAGRDNMGGTASGRLTTTYFNPGGTSNPDALGAAGGAQSHTQTISEMALHNHDVNDPKHFHTQQGLGTGSGTIQTVSASEGNSPTATNTTTISASTGITISNQGASQAFSVVQPTITLNYVVKVTPDTSTSIATGVYSIGGMTGVISCSTGILCTGNYISAFLTPGGSDTQVQFNNNNQLGGNSNFTFLSPDTLSLGASGTSFKFDIYGFTSGKVRQVVQAVAGTTIISWGNLSGVPAVVATTPLTINSTTGTIACISCATIGPGGALTAQAPITLSAAGVIAITPAALSKGDDTNVTLTLSGNPNSALISAATITAGWTGQLAVSRGGTGIASGTSGGIPYFSSGTTIASSALLAANQIVLGGGAATTPATLGSLGTTTTVLHGNAAGAPTFAAVSLTADISGILPLANGGTNANLTASNGGIFYSTASAGAILSGTATANLPLLSGSSTTPSWATVSHPTSATSGGVAYFSSTTVMASSGLLGANQLMIGGGAGAAPSTFACATTTTVVHGGTPPTCSQIVAADITTNTITNSNLIQAIASTFKGNPTGSTATVQDFTIQGLSNLASPSATLDFIPIYDHATGIIKNVTPGAIAGSVVAGVSSVNTLTGALTIVGSSGIVVNSGGTAITITPDTATAANFEAGTAAKMLDANVVFTSEVTTTFGTTTAFDFNTFINSKVTLTGNITTMNCSNMKQSQAGTIAFIQDGTGSRTAAFNTGTCSTVLKFASATFPTLTTSASAVDILSYSCRSSTYCPAALSKGYNP